MCNEVTSLKIERKKQKNEQNKKHIGSYTPKYFLNMKRKLAINFINKFDCKYSNLNKIRYNECLTSTLHFLGFEYENIEEDYSLNYYNLLNKYFSLTDSTYYILFYFKNIPFYESDIDIDLNPNNIVLEKDSDNCEIKVPSSSHNQDFPLLMIVQHKNDLFIPFDQSKNNDMHKSLEILENNLDVNLKETTYTSDFGEHSLGSNYLKKFNLKESFKKFHLSTPLRPSFSNIEHDENR